MKRKILNPIFLPVRIPKQHALSIVALITQLRRRYKDEQARQDPTTFAEYIDFISVFFGSAFVADLFGGMRVESVAKKFVLSLKSYHDKKFAKVLKQAKIPRTILRNIDFGLTERIHKNVSLIKDIPNKLRAQMFKTIVEAQKKTGFDQASLSDKVHNLIAEKHKLCFKQASTRARLIARDQTNKTIATLTELRHKEIGINSYIWLGVDDERERPSHVANNNQEFNYDIPPDTGNPGHDYNCRCVALGVLKELRYA